VKDSADGEPFVIVERMIEDAGAYAAAVEHEIFATMRWSWRDRWEIGLWRRGEEGASSHHWRRRLRLSLLQMRVAMFVEVDGSGGAAVLSISMRWT